MVCVVHMSVFVHTTAPCSICFSVFVFVVPPCPCGRTSEHADASWHHRVESLLLHGQSALSVTFSPTVTSWCGLPRLLCRCRLAHGSHMVQRLHALCPAHRSRSVLPIPRFRRAPPALSQVTLCQPCLLRLPRISPLPHSWSVASLLMLHRRPSDPSPLHLWMPLRRLFHTPLPLGMFLRNSRSGSSWLHLPRTMFLCPTCALPVPSLLLDAAVQTPLHSVATHDASTQLPLTEFFIGCILSNDPLDRQASPSAHCNAGSASPPQPADIATLCSTSSASHASDGHEHTTAPRVLLQPPPGLEKYARQFASHGTPVQAALVRPRLCTSVSVTPPAATCQYHPSGNTSFALSYYLQAKCKYCPCGNPQFCWCRSSCKNWSFS